MNVKKGVLRMKILTNNYSMQRINNQTNQGIKQSKGNSNPVSFGTLNVKSFTKSLDTPEGAQKIIEYFNIERYNPVEIITKLKEASTEFAKSVAQDKLPKLSLDSIINGNVAVMLDKPLPKIKNDIIREMASSSNTLRFPKNDSRNLKSNFTEIIRNLYETKQKQIQDSYELDSTIEKSPMLKNLLNKSDFTEIFNSSLFENYSQEFDFLKDLIHGANWVTDIIVRDKNSSIIKPTGISIEPFKFHNFVYDQYYHKGFILKTGFELDDKFAEMANSTGAITQKEAKSEHIAMEVYPKAPQSSINFVHISGISGETANTLMKAYTPLKELCANLKGFASTQKC